MARNRETETTRARNGKKEAVASSAERTATKTAGHRNEQIGTVVKSKMTKTVVVAVERLVQHPVYRKTIKRTSTFMAHDEKGAKQGDRVRIVETRPLSRNKRWRVEEIPARWFERSTGTIAVAVADAGEGIAADALPRIFDRFYKGSSSQGSGLGLTLCKRFVELHGGSIRVESTVGRGSTFTFSLPVEQRAPV